MASFVTAQGRALPGSLATPCYFVLFENSAVPRAISGWQDVALANVSRICDNTYIDSIGVSVMRLRKLATAAALASALTMSTVSHAAVPTVASAASQGDNIGGLGGTPFFVYFMGASILALLIKVTVDNSTSP